MGFCVQCRINILDSTDICPLCRCAVECAGDRDRERAPAYPCAEKKRKKIQLALDIYCAAAIATEVILVYINLQVESQRLWSILTGAFLLYTYFTLKCSVLPNVDYRVRMILQVLLGVSVVALIDYIAGFHGWSLNYVLPSAFLLIDIMIVILTIANRKSWQSYMGMQLLMVILSILAMLTRLFKFYSGSPVCVIAAIMSLLMFVCTLIIGGRKARSELYRRFHV